VPPSFYIRLAKVDGIPVSLWTFVTEMMIIQVPLFKKKTCFTVQVIQLLWKSF